MAVIDSRTFLWQDYLVFACALALSSAIGIYHWFKSRHENTKEDFLLAGRKMSVLPVSVSLLVSWLSAVSMLGDPTEVYNYGVGYWFVGIGYMIAPLVVAFVFAPVYYRAQNISAYQLLKERYGVEMRTFGSVTMGTILLLYMGVALYAPCIAVNQMTGLRVEVCILIVGGICTFYTSMGGMKAVLWADTLQTFIMVGGLLATVIQGMITVGGPGEVFRVAAEGRRTEINIDPNPLARTSIWWYIIGGFFNIFGPYISSQMIIQRFCTLKSESDIKKAVALNTPIFGLFVSLFSLLGLTMYAYFRHCDPLSDGKISRPDQIMPLMVMETLGPFPGMPGLFLACVCSAALSTLSSGLSGIAATALEDIIQPIYYRKTGRIIKPLQAKRIAIGLSIGFGFFHILLAYGNLLLKNTTIFGLVHRISGALTGPMTAIFFICILLRRIDAMSVIIGVAGGVIMSLWFAIGSFIDPPTHLISSKLPVSVEGCVDGNITATTVYPLNISTTGQYSALRDDVMGGHELESFRYNTVYGLAPMLFSPFGFSIALIISLITSTVKRFVCGRSRANVALESKTSAKFSKVPLDDFEMNT